MRPAVLTIEGFGRAPLDLPIEVAETRAEMASGLRGRPASPGMGFPLASVGDAPVQVVTMYMDGVGRPLDFLLVDGADFIAATAQGVTQDLAMHANRKWIYNVYELPAGTIRKHGIHAGMTARVSRWRDR